MNKVKTREYKKETGLNSTILAVNVKVDVERTMKDDMEI